LKSEAGGDKLLLKLKRDWQLLKKSKTTLDASLKKCKKIGIKSEYNFEEAESFDAFTSKFARTADIFTQKIIKTSILALREEADAFVDRMNVGEKTGMLSSADLLIQIRDLRNSILHEYEEEDIKKIYIKTLEYAPLLLNEVYAMEHFLTERNWI